MSELELEIEKEKTKRSKSRWCAMSLVGFTGMFTLVSIVLGAWAPMVILAVILGLGGWCSDKND